jgi:hypothetical protein
MANSNQLSDNELALVNRLRELRQFDGWKDLKKIFEDKVHSLDTVRTCDTLKDLQARKQVIKMLESFWGMIEILAESSEIIPKLNKPEALDIIRQR